MMKKNGKYGMKKDLCLLTCCIVLYNTKYLIIKSEEICIPNIMELSYLDLDRIYHP